MMSTTQEAFVRYVTRYSVAMRAPLVARRRRDTKTREHEHHGVMFGSRLRARHKR